MNRIFILVLSLSLLAGACKKNPDVTALPVSNQHLLKTIAYQGLPSPYYQFEYETSGRISTASFASGAFSYNLFYQGTQLKDMKSIVAATKIHTTYQYDNMGRISFVKLSSEDGSTVFKRGFLTYDAQNRLTEIEWELNTPAGFAVQRTLNFTYHADGNLLERKDHRHFMEGRQPEAIYIDRYEQYDDKVNVDGFALLHESSEHLVLFPGVVLQRNNPAKNIRTGDGINYEITYTYSYNEDKYPLQRSGNMRLTNGPQAGQTFQLTAAYQY